MASEKTITITVNESKFNIDMQGFINKAEGLAYMTLATKTVMGELLKNVADNQEQLAREVLSSGVCSCPACEAKQANGLKM